MFFKTGPDQPVQEIEPSTGPGFGSNKPSEPDLCKNWCFLDKPLETAVKLVARENRS